MNKNKIITNLKHLNNSVTFWVRLATIGIWLIAFHMFFMTEQEDGVQRVYVDGGDIDADVSGTVSVDNVYSTVPVEVENTVDVRGSVYTW